MKFRVTCLSLILLLSTAGPAAAYLDPGTGSFMIQLLIGFFAAVFFGAKRYWQRLKSFFVKNREDQTDTDV